MTKTIRVDPPLKVWLADGVCLPWLHGQGRQTAELGLPAQLWPSTPTPNR